MVLIGLNLIGAAIAAEAFLHHFTFPVLVDEDTALVPALAVVIVFAPGASTLEVF